MSDAMGIVNKLIDLAKSVQEWRKGTKKANLKLFFGEHVDPVFHQMKRIHRDYVDGLGGLLQRMHSGELPPRELYEWFEQKRRPKDLEYKSSTDATLHRIGTLPSVNKIRANQIYQICFFNVRINKTAARITITQNTRLTISSKYK